MSGDFEWFAHGLVQLCHKLQGGLAEIRVQFQVHRFMELGAIVFCRCVVSW